MFVEVSFLVISDLFSQVLPLLPVGLVFSAGLFTGLPPVAPCCLVIEPKSVLHHHVAKPLCFFLDTFCLLLLKPDTSSGATLFLLQLTKSNLVLRRVFGRFYLNGGFLS